MPLPDCSLGSQASERKSCIWCESFTQSNRGSWKEVDLSWPNVWPLLWWLGFFNVKDDAPCCVSSFFSVDSVPAVDCLPCPFFQGPSWTPRLRRRRSHRRSNPAPCVTVDRSSSHGAEGFPNAPWNQSSSEPHVAAVGPHSPRWMAKRLPTEIQRI